MEISHSWNGGKLMDRPIASKLKLQFDNIAHVADT